MMRSAIVVLVVGLAAGLLDLIPLVMVGAPALNMIAIVVFWMVAVLFMATTSLAKNAFLNGLLVAVLIMLPLILTVYTVNPSDALPMLSMAVLLGPLSGAAVRRGLRR